jgi:ribonuclease E
MLIDASHPEETRVVVTKGSRVEEFDFESALRKQLRGNIYLAKVTRVEPSLQAAFVDFGGNRHGFLAFSEIHPDYYQIPVADREALLADEARAQAEEDENANGGEERRPRSNRRRRGRPERTRRQRPASEEVSEAAPADGAVEDHSDSEGEANAAISPDQVEALDSATGSEGGANDGSTGDEPHVEAAPGGSVEARSAEDDHAPSQDSDDAGDDAETEAAADGDTAGAEGNHDAEDGLSDDQPEEIIDQIGGDDALEEMPSRSYRSRRQYKIQEVIKRRQILLVQVVKEERGNKGAALTTYLSLAGRYSVLMPNTARGGGISRKITSSEDRKRLKTIAQDLEVPDGMGVILRTAGAARTKVEVKRDFEYLMRLWESVRELTLQSTAPALVYEEGSLIKRAIRDLYSKDVEEIQVAGDDGYREAKDFMKMLMPSHAKMVKLYKEPQPLFARFGIEQQLDAMFNNVVQLRSGGYIVINQTEALVSIDVNSGRATREHNIEDTALKTNLEAAEEVARQLRLRDLAGLIVIDFIDMEEKRNNRAVERKIADCLKNDRARIQLGRISHFGLLEMSRQRIRTGVLESSTSPCPHCAGTGLKRATASIALNLVRALEEALLKNAAYDIVARTPSEIALYVLNHKREILIALENRFGVHISLKTDESILAPVYYQFERGELASRPVQAKTHIDTTSVAPSDAIEDEDEADAAVDEASDDDAADEGDQDAREERGDGNGRRKRRRRRRRGGRNGEGEAFNADAQDTGDAGNETTAEAEDGDAEARGDNGEDNGEGNGEETGEDRPRRRRRRRGGRRNRREDVSTSDNGEDVSTSDNEEEAAADVAEPEQEAPARRSRRIEIRAPEPEADAAAAAEDLPAEPQGEPPHDEHIVRREIVEGDEGPIAASNPHNQPHEDEAPAKKKPALFSEEELAADEAQRPRRTGWWAKAKTVLGG